MSDERSRTQEELLALQRWEDEGGRARPPLEDSQHRAVTPLGLTSYAKEPW